MGLPRMHECTLELFTQGMRRQVTMCCAGATNLQGYQMPSQTITSLLDTPMPPSYAFSPDRTKVRFRR